MLKHSIFFALLVSFVFSDSSMAAGLNKTDKKGRQGQWEKLYPNGNKMYEGQFKNDVPFGVFKRYAENGNLQSVQTYGKGDESSVVFYEFDGKTVSTEGKFKGKLKVGEWKYYSNGTLILTEMYVDGKKNGVSKSYREGKLLEETPYKNDLKDGVEKAYLPDGKLYAETTYKEGKLHGPYKMYEGNETPVETGEFNNDNRHGKWAIYDENGKQLEETVYVNGQLQETKKLQKEQFQQLKENERNKGKFTEPSSSEPKN